MIGMSAMDNSSQLPPKDEIEPDQSLHATSEQWFEYPIRVYPHQTDYAGIVWHGSYLQWLEEARIEYLRSLGLDYGELVALGCDFPVVELSLRYHHSLRLGDAAIIRTQMQEMSGVRMHWNYDIQSLDRETKYLSAKVTLVAVDREQGKVMRSLPPSVKNILVKLQH